MPNSRPGVLRRLARRLTASREPHDLERAIQDIGQVQHEQAARLETRLSQLAERINQRSTGRDANEILHAIRSLTRALEPEGDGRLYKSLDAIAAGTGPIVVGPWTGEVGFEALYWVPFVEWVRTRWRIVPERLFVISRGGTAAWYGADAARYADIFSLVTPAVFRERTAGGSYKQQQVGAFDREIVEAATRGRALESAPQLHPELMYRALAPFWRDEAGFALIDRFTAPRRFEPPSDPVLDSLPPDFVAARFYFSGAFPDEPANRAVAARLIERLARSGPVVLLDPGLRVDDHADLAAPVRANVITLPQPPSPERNLAVQSAVISRARAFVGTYGGYSYLAPFYGVPALALYSRTGFKLHHLHVAQRTFAALGTATVVPVHTDHVETVLA